jgi:uncharacterized membrane protein (DUF485 family)
MPGASAVPETADVSTHRHATTPSPGVISTGGVMGTTNSAADGDRYLAVYESARFRTLRRRSNAFITWASITFFGWWFLVILLAAFAPGVLRTGLGGPMNVGLLFIGLSLAFVVTLSAVYLRYARTRLDPLSEQIRADLEGDLR